MKRYQKRYLGSTCSVLKLDKGDRIEHTYGVDGKLERLSDIVKGQKATGGVNCDFFNMQSSAKQETISWSLSKEGYKDFSRGDNYIEIALRNDGKLVVEDLPKDLTNYKWITMGGFTLIKNGSVRIEKKGYFPHYRYRHPRTAIGQTINGSIILLTVDGRRWNERGMNAYTLAELMKSLGCVTACSLDGGGSTEMYFSDLGIYNRPAGERYIGGAFVVYGKINKPYCGLVKYGSRGHNVKEVQSFLGAKPDGIYGIKTKQAIIRYQANNNLVQDGIVGPITWAKMFND